MSEKIEQIKAVFAKYGGEVKLSALHRGTKYENELEIKKQPDGIPSNDLARIVETFAKGKQHFFISTSGTWLGLALSLEFQKQLAICLKVMIDLSAIDPALVGPEEKQ
jgi:signal transduction histidine kinase